MQQERKICCEVTRKLKGTAQKVRRAQILLKADADGPAWTDTQIAEAFSCRTQTVENIRQRFVERGFQDTLDRKPAPRAGAKKLLTGDEEAQIIAMRLGSPPEGYGKWTLRLLARKVVELQIVPHVCHETIRQTLKKTKWRPKTASSTG
ncbi:MAG: helix-turn-helix domain-containing protein [Pirellulaceae bacterium]|nr:helix-turn-helix domain-containing protein [Planctomycetales bacterium]